MLVILQFHSDGYWIVRHMSKITDAEAAGWQFAKVARDEGSHTFKQVLVTDLEELQKLMYTSS